MPHGVEIIPSRAADVGGSTVLRALPTRGRRTVGAWCFADHFGSVASPTETFGIGPHPHIGLQTVTWLVGGEVLHRDSLGTEQAIRPGQLNLMTAGRGVAHAEEPLSAGIQGAQLWVAMPEPTRGDAPAFEHHVELPLLEFGAFVATVLLGSVAGSGASSPARADTPIMGIELFAGRSAEAELPLDSAFEHAVVVLEGAITVDGDGEGDLVRPGAVALLGAERDHLALRTTEPTRALLLGGEPFPERIQMWWNFAARNQDELRDARDAWDTAAARFGNVASGLARVPAPPFD